MRKLNALVVALAAGLWLTASAQGQETNAWPGWVMTRLEAAQTNSDRVIVHASSPVGVVGSSRGTLGISCKEITELGWGKTYGIGITLSEGQQPGETALIDYEELDPLLNGLDYLSRINWSVTSLTGFDAFFTTKDGFRVTAFSRTRTGTVEMAVRALRYNQPPLMLRRDQVAQLRDYIAQAKGKLDELRAGR